MEIKLATEYWNDRHFDVLVRATATDNSHPSMLPGLKQRLESVQRALELRAVLLFAWSPRLTETRFSDRCAKAR